MTDLRTWLVIAVICLVTVALRFLPFLIFNGKRKTPRVIEKLSKILPCAVMGMLVVYCFKDLSFAAAAGYLPAVIASLVVALLYVWKRNTLISIVCGTVGYMLLVQFVF